MSGIRPRIAAIGQQVAIERGELRLEVCLRPFHSPALRTPPHLAGSVWVAEGTVRDRFIRLTEGVPAHEKLLPHERAEHGAVADATLNRVELIVALHGGRRVRLAAAIGEAEDVRLELSAPIHQRYAWLWNGIGVPTSASSAWARHGAVAPLDRIPV